MRQLSYRDTWSEISIPAIKHNIWEYKRFIGHRVKLMGVVKADGYGHGAAPIARAVLEAGANYLGVAILDEALELRATGITEPILVLGFTPNRSIEEAIIADIDLTVYSVETLDEIILLATKLKKSVCIHLKVDTGMSRIGVQSSQEALSLAEKAMSCPYVFLKGIFTHFANADSDDSSYTYKQYERFKEVISCLQENNIEIPIKHCCNTAGTMNFPEMHLDMVRVGIGLYGLYPDQSLKSHSITLKQAMSLKTKVASLKVIPPLQPISYGCTNIPTEETIIATLPIGYGDGLSRLLSNRGYFLLHGQKVPVVGRVCMDQTMVDVGKIYGCTLGDVVTIFGTHDGASQSIDEIAMFMGTINYEVVCLIGERVPRYYSGINSSDNGCENQNVQIV
jgi:alanine racemase